MAYETKDHIIRMLARTNIHELAVTESLDYGRSWSETKLSGIDSPGTRFYISRTPTGRLLLVNNDAREQRTNMTIYLSEDDGKTWRYKCCIDTRNDLSYPDVDFYNGKIYLTYDRERCGAKEILLSCFTEDEIISGKKDFEIKIISKPV